MVIIYDHCILYRVYSSGIYSEYIYFTFKTFILETDLIMIVFVFSNLF